MTDRSSQLPAVYLATPYAQLFLALVETLCDSVLLNALHPQWEVWPDMSCFQIPPFREAQARLAALDPLDLHRRIFAQRIPPESLIGVLLAFHLPMTGVVASTPGFTVCIDYGEMGVGRRVWLRYSPEKDEAAAVEAFRTVFFPDREEWDWYRPMMYVVPGRFLHALAPPGQEDEFFEHLSS